MSEVAAPARELQRFTLGLDTLRNRGQPKTFCEAQHRLYDFAAVEAISGDVQLARRFEQFTLSRWAANEQFESLAVSILRNTPLRQPSVLSAKSLRRMLQITEGITANIFHIINSLAISVIHHNGSFPETRRIASEFISLVTNSTRRGPRD